MARVGVHLLLLLLLHLTVAMKLKRCLQRKPSSRCTYTCNRRTGQWIEVTCEAPVVAKQSLSPVAKAYGLRSCTGPRPGKSTGGCGNTCNRKLGQWKEAPTCPTEESYGCPGCFLCDNFQVTNTENR